MKRLLTLFLSVALAAGVTAQTDVTKKYITNPDFGSRFAAWYNVGSFSFNTASNFPLKNGDVYMEKWVAKGSKLGTNKGMYQTLRDLPEGTYTLVAAAQHINQNLTSQVCKGAYLFAGNEQVEINAAQDYSVVFTVANGKANIGVRLENCTGNWVCIDNFRLYYNGVNEDSLAAEKARVDEEMKTFRTNVENSTAAAPVVKTEPFVPVGTTIALGRMSATGANIIERGFCYSTEPNPTVFDERATEYFSNNGNIYRIEGLTPSKFYYVRAYAINKDYAVGYGDVVKIATLPKGGVNYGYDFAGDAETNARINSASAETVWLYNNLASIQNYYLNVHYVPGAGAGNGTADCSYGGWMRVSQNVPYQQTGTILHESNHGVGVGTTGDWYNNANLRAGVTRGDWLGPLANKMVRFFDNNSTSVMTGDGTHMWPYGINGAGEDSYNPANYALYYANVFITHAMHQDGLPCTSSVGFATPAYVFQQADSTKYYIKTEDASAGGQTSFLTLSDFGGLRSVNASAEEAKNDDKFAWYIHYDPATSYYIFYNVGLKRYLSYSSSTFKGVTANLVDASMKFHLMPCREDITLGKYKGTSYWIIKNKQYALEAGTFNAASGYYSTKSASYNASNSAKAQRWLFLSEGDIETYESEALSGLKSDLDEVISQTRKLVATPHVSNVEGTTTDEVDLACETVLNTIDEAKASYTSPADISAAVSSIEAARSTFLSSVNVTDSANPFDLTFLLVNPSVANDCNGWSTSGTVSYQCCEFYQSNFDFNQTTKVALPKGTYEVKVQAFQRPGSAADTYTDYKANGDSKVTTYVYGKTKTAKVKNIWADAQTKSLGGSPSTQGGLNVPNNMAAARKWFDAGLYDNSVMVNTTANATFKLGIKSTANTTSSYWAIFANFRLYYYGNLTTDQVTGVETVRKEDAQMNSNVYYDLSGRKVQNPSNGFYISNGKKIYVK